MGIVIPGIQLHYNTEQRYLNKLNVTGLLFRAF